MTEYAKPANFYHDPCKTVDGLINYERGCSPCRCCTRRDFHAWDIYGCADGHQRKNIDDYCKYFEKRQDITEGSKMPDTS